MSIYRDELDRNKGFCSDFLKLLIIAVQRIYDSVSSEWPKSDAIHKTIKLQYLSTSTPWTSNSPKRNQASQQIARNSFLN